MTFILLLVLIPVILSFVLTSSLKKRSVDKNVSRSISAAVNDNEKEQTALSVKEITTVSSTTAVTSLTTTTAVTNALTTADNALPPDRYVGTSPNSAFYQERMFIAGDSITLGLQYYGFIPPEHSLSRESVSMWNLSRFKFNINNKELELPDAVEEKKPALLYMWLGMNDINQKSPEKYIKKYREVIDDITKRLPNVIIIVTTITPASSDVSVVRNDVIRDYNAALKEMVKRCDSPNILFFDAYSVICDENLCLREGYSSGDGMHLYIPCYTDILTALFDFLDTTNVKEQLAG